MSASEDSEASATGARLYMSGVHGDARHRGRRNGAIASSSGRGSSSGSGGDGSGDGVTPP